MKEFSREQVAYCRLVKSGLETPFKSAADCASALFGMQAQAQQFAEIALYNRVKDLTAADLKKQFDNKEFIKVWAQRMTVHLFHKNDWCAVTKVFAPYRKGAIKKYLEITDKNVENIFAKFGKEKTLTKDKVKEIIDSEIAHIDKFYRDTCIIMAASASGIICGAAERPHTKNYFNKKILFSQAEYKKWDAVSGQKALEDLMLLYFANYGPASYADFLHWSGLKKTDTFKIFEKIKNKLDSYKYNEVEIYAVKNDNVVESVKQNGVKRIVKLLGKFDSLFVCYKDKTWSSDTKHHKQIWRPAAHVESILILGSEAAGTWRYSIKGANIDFQFNLFKKITAADKKDIKEQAQRLAKFLSKKLHTISYEGY
ncbi:hypothetical protein Dip510_000294 [Elusimicrobium posterum]|uniref:DNA glycosylase AlkZ-like family protein n=1 Tax=Elusimicrobium posterum TaxID=3116653 RepID=UPI003C78DE7B